MSDLDLSVCVMVMDALPHSGKSMLPPLHRYANHACSIKGNNFCYPLDADAFPHDADA